MRSRINIPLLVGLLLWVGLLCLSGILRTSLPAVAYQIESADTTAEQLTIPESKGAVAWAEPYTFSSLSAADVSLQFIFKYYKAQLWWSIRYCPKPIYPVFGVSSLSEQFRILPNAP